MVQGKHQALVSIPYRKPSNKFYKEAIEKMLSEFQFLIGNLVTKFLAYILVPAAKFQFLIGNLVTHAEKHQRGILSRVSIPYRKPSNCSTRFFQLLPKKVSIPYRKPSNVILLVHGQLFGHVSIPYRKPSNISSD